MLLASGCVIFGDFRFNVPTRELSRIGNHGSATPISLGSRAADLLHLFLRRPGELITKSEIMDAVWPNVAVEESNLTVQISALRRALGSGRNGASYIQTVPGRGYRFTPWVNNSAPPVKEANGSGMMVPAGTAGAFTADHAEPFPQDLLASPESGPSLPQPHVVASPLVPADDAAVAAVRPQHTGIWWLFCLQGMTGIILGLMLLTAPGVTTAALVSFLALYWLIMGILAIVRIFVDQSVPRFWSLLAGLVGVVAGVFVPRHPLLMTLTVPTAIVIVLGVQGLIMGAIEIVAGLMGGGIGSFILAGIYLPVGLFLVGSPVVAALETPLGFAMLFLAQGVALTALAFRTKA